MQKRTHPQNGGWFRSEVATASPRRPGQHRSQGDAEGTERRYASAEQFAEDVRRYLQGLPVSARQDSWSYRTGKFIRRHTAIVAATMVVILTLAVGMAQ